jgi:hypothetical protein
MKPVACEWNVCTTFKITLYSRNVIDVDWELVVKLALPGKVTKRAYKVFGIYDRFLTNVQFNYKF